MNNSSQSFRSRQPGKILWTMVAIMYVTIRMHFSSIYSIPKSTRQHPKWTYRQALTNELIRTSFYHMTLIKFTMPLSMEPDAEKERINAVTPQDDIYKGVLRNPAIQPTIVGGTWYPKLFQPGDEQKTVILHFYGGLFLWGTGRQSDWGSCINSVEANTYYCPLRTVSSCFGSRLYLPCCGSRRSNSLQSSPRHDHPCIKHCDIWRFRRRQRCHRTATIPFYRKQQQSA